MTGVGSNVLEEMCRRGLRADEWRTSNAAGSGSEYGWLDSPIAIHNRGPPFRHNVLVAFYFVAFDECRARPDLGLTLRVAEVLLRCSTLEPLVSSGNFFKLADLIWVGSVRNIPTAKKNSLLGNFSSAQPHLKEFPSHI